MFRRSHETRISCVLAVLALIITSLLMIPTAAAADDNIVEPPGEPAERVDPPGPRPEPAEAPDRPDNPGSYEALVAVELAAADNKSVGLIKLSETFDQITVPLVGASATERLIMQQRLQAVTGMTSDEVTIQVVRGKVTRDELDAMNKAAQAVLIERGVEGWSVGIDVDTSSISISLSPAEMAARNGRGAKAIEAAILRHNAFENPRRRGVRPTNLLTIDSGTATSTDTRQQLPFDVANWLEVENSGHCTAGFLFVRGNGDLRGTSAGHCQSVAGVGKEVSTTKGNFVGTTVTRIYGGQAGADILGFTVPGHTGWNCIQTSPNGGCHLVTSAIVESQSNAWVCHSGLGLWREEGIQASCGNIKKIDMSLENSDGRIMKNMDCSEDRAYRGDSGGAVWHWGDNRGVWAAGNTAVSLETGRWWAKKYYTCYHPVTDVEKHTGYKMVTH